MKQLTYAIIISSSLAIVSCKKDKTTTARNPDTADRAMVDRFSATAGHLMVRDASNGLPGPGVAINYDAPGKPFLTKGYGPNGEIAEYYNFDVQTTKPAPIYVLFHENESSPVANQLNIVDDIPGDADYNDFWQVMKVTVPAGYVANTVTSYAEIVSAGYNIEPMNALVNCPIVPEGSTASKRFNGGSAALSRGWYKDKVVFYFNFGEDPNLILLPEIKCRWRMCM